MSTPRALTLVAALGSLGALSIPAGVAAAPGGSGEIDSSLVTVLEPGRTIESVLVSDGTAFAGGLDGMGIYDVRDPAHAIGLGSTNGWIRGLAIDGETLFVQEGSSSDGSVVVLDVSDPAAPAVEAWIEPPAIPGVPPSDFPPQLGFEPALAVRDGLLYVVSRDFVNPFLIYRALDVYDVRDPASPTLLGQAPLQQSADARQIVVARGYAYVSSSQYLEPVDVGTPARPVAASPVTTPSAGVAVDGLLLYSCSGILGGEVEVYTLGDPARPRHEGAILAPSELMDCSALALAEPVPGRRFLVVAWDADGMPWLDVYDVTPPIRVGDASLLMNRGRITGLTNDSVSAVQVDGSLVYTAQWYSGVRVSSVDWSSVLQAEQRIEKVPGKGRVVLTRAAGIARWRFAAMVSSRDGDPIAGKTVRLERSVGGGTWQVVATLRTDARGAVVRALVFRRPGTTSWRWTSPADSSWSAARTSSTRVVVR